MIEALIPLWSPQRPPLTASQTKSVKDLARLSLSDTPEYLAVHDAATSATPAKLAQAYVICGLPDKLNLLFSFIRTHIHAKVIVFVSSCKQGRFVFEAFRRLRPGVPLQVSKNPRGEDTISCRRAASPCPAAAARKDEAAAPHACLLRLSQETRGSPLCGTGLVRGQRGSR